MKSLNKKPIVLFDIDDTMFNTALFIQSGLSENKAYEEVMQTLESLSSFATLGIFSKGETQFQKNKLEKAEMLKYFKEENVHIFEDKNINLMQVINKYKRSKIFLVDDRLEVLYSAKKNMEQIFTIWAKRGRYAQNQQAISGFTPDAEVENLSEVARIVQLEIKN
jgi:FMN phosphatase YigB (HAD superfamily)